jgi:Protein of unknown function (DUF3618)
MDERTGTVQGSSAATTEQNGEQRARQIRAEIERTRGDLAETVDAIQERLRPTNVVASAASATAEKVKDMAQSAGETAQELWETSGGTGLVQRIRNNPVPAVLASVGIVWLAFSNGQRRQNRYARRGGAGERRPGEQGSASAASGRSMLQETSATTRRVVRQSSRRIESMVRDYPLAVGAAAAIVGVSLGMVVPETERENELMGETRDNTIERAQEAASGAVERVKDAAADVVTRAAIGD